MMSIIKQILIPLLDPSAVSHQNKSIYDRNLGN